LVTRAALESVLAEAVRNSPDCNGFVGIIVERVVPPSRGGANWTLKGVRYGKADRGQCSAVISNYVQEWQQKFDITD
jgi:hypothetical protein